MTDERELAVPGVRLRYPPEADVEHRALETRRYRVRRIHVRSPWMESAETPGAGTRYEVRILAFEDPDGEPVGDLLADGPLSPRAGEFDLVPGELAGREAVIREPVDATRIPRAAYVQGERRFFFVEWKGPAGTILDSLELDPGGGSSPPDDATTPSPHPNGKEHR